VCISVDIPCNQPTLNASKQAANQGQFAFDEALIAHADPTAEVQEKTPDFGDREAISQGILIARLVHRFLIFCLSLFTSMTRISSSFAYVGAIEGGKVGEVDGADGADGADEADGIF